MWGQPIEDAGVTTAADVMARVRKNEAWRRKMMHGHSSDELPHAPATEAMEHKAKPRRSVGLIPGPLAAYLEWRDKVEIGFGWAPGRKKMTAGEIIATVCRALAVARTDLLSGSRQKGLTDARHVAAWLSRQLTSLSLSQIGTRLGRSNHTTILNSIHRIDVCIQAGDALGNLALRLLAELQGAERKQP